MKKKSVYAGSLILALMSLSGCNSGSTSSNNSNSATGNNSLKREINQMKPGYGYSTLTEQLSSQACYATKAHQIGQSGDVDATVQFGASTFRKKLEGELNINVSTGLSSFDSMSRYVNEQQDTALSTSVYITQYVTRSVAVSADDEEGSIWTTLGKTQYNRLLAGDISMLQFSKLCGDRMIDSYQEGAFYTIKMTFTFDSAVENYLFSTEAKYETMFTTVNGKVSTEFDMSNMHGNLTVSAHQEGGKPAELGKILSNIDSGLTCNFTNMYECKDLISRLGNYGDEFQAQIDHDSDQDGDNEISLGEIAYKVQPGDPFSDYVDGLSRVVVPDDVKAGRQTLLADGEMISDATSFFNKVMISESTLQSIQNLNESQYLNTYYQKLKAIHEAFYNPKLNEVNPSECWSQPDYCPEIAATVHNSLKNFQTYFLELKSTSNAAESINKVVAIVDLDDESDLITGKHYIRLFNYKSGHYIGKIPYIEDNSKSVFDNVGYSLAAGYASEPSAIYNNGYFFASLGKVEFKPFEYLLLSLYNATPAVCSPSGTTESKALLPEDHDYISSSYHLADKTANIFEIYDGIYEQQCGTSSGTLLPIPDVNSYATNGARLIISHHNQSLKYIGNGEIIPQSLIIIGDSESHDLLDPTSLTSSRQIKQVQTTGKIYYANQLQDPNGVQVLSEKAIPAIYKTARIRVVQSNSYHQGSELPGFKLKLSVLSDAAK